MAVSWPGTLLHVATGRQQRTVARSREWVWFDNGGGKTATLDANLSR